MSELTPGDVFEMKSNPSRVKVHLYSCHFFTSDWINGHNLVMLVVILLAVCARFEWYIKNHVTQNGCHVQVLCVIDFTTMQHAYVRFNAVSEFLYT